MKTINVLGIGSAIVDVLSVTTDAHIADLGLVKASMALIDEGQAQGLFSALKDARESSGGSIANSIAGVGSLGGSAAFIGKVKQDRFGDIFIQDLEKSGAKALVKISPEGASTAQCYVFVSEDKERTMATYLGIAGSLDESDLNTQQIEQAQFIFIEGYLWDSPSASNFLDLAIPTAHQFDTQVVVSLSDAYCVDRHRSRFTDLMAHHADIIIGNEHEFESLFQVTGIENILAKLRDQKSYCRHFVITRSEHGSLIFNDGVIDEIGIVSLGKIEDKTGAGDLYAAGYLYGLAKGLSPQESGAIAATCAAEAISHIGARPKVILQDLIRQRGLIGT